MTMLTLMMLIALTQGPVRERPVLRPALVMMQLGSPVVLEGSRSTPEQVFAAVVVRNTSDRAIAAVTFGVTIGRTVGAPGEEIVRRGLRIEAGIAPGAAETLALPPLTDTAGLAPRAITGATVELGVLEVRFEDGSTWEATVGSTWLGQPDVTVPVRCADAACVYAPGEMSLASASARQCAANGRFLVPCRDKEGR